MNWSNGILVYEIAFLPFFFIMMLSCFFSWVFFSDGEAMRY